MRMQTMRAMVIKRAAKILSVVVCSTAFLTSCKGGKAAAPEQNAEPEQDAVALQQQAVLQQQEQQLLDYMIFQVGDKLRKEAEQSEWRETVRDMRNEVEKYYDKLRETRGNSERLVRIGLFLADAANDLNSGKAQGLYEKVSEDLEALPNDVRAAIPMRRVESLVESGKGYCLMQQRKTDEALPHYEKALQLDQERYHRLVPDDRDGLPKGKDLSEDIEQAAADLLTSYRCLADCQLSADDPEQARDNLATAIKIAQRMKNLSPTIAVAVIRSVISMGDLENQLGNKDKALDSWESAWNLANDLGKRRPPLAVQALLVRLLNKLKPCIQNAREQVQRQKAEEAERQQEQTPTPEDVPAA